MKMRLVRTSVVALAGFSLVACTATDLDGNKNAIGGALAGAIGGAVAGNIIGEEKSTKRGAILGAIAGGAIGANLDKQEAMLRDQIGGSGAMIQNTGDQLIVTLPEGITFDLNSSVVKPRFQGTLSQFAANLQEFPNSRVSVVGHTDNTGDVGFNQRLSEARARSVANVLIGNGVNPGRIATSGQGEFSPVASNSTAEGRQQNRRVVITITPTGA